MVWEGCLKWLRRALRALKIQGLCDKLLLVSIIIIDYSFLYDVYRITKDREQIVNKTFVKIMDELGYDVDLIYKKKATE